jgi:hypothetical protein
MIRWQARRNPGPTVAWKHGKIMFPVAENFIYYLLLDFVILTAGFLDKISASWLYP